MQLCERFWSNFYPQMDGDDASERIGNLSWLLQRVVALASSVPLTRSASGRYSLMQLKAARAQQSTLERSPHKAVQLPENAVTLEKFNLALQETPSEALLESLQALKDCLPMLAQLQAIIDSHLGAEGPNFVPAREALETALHDVTRLAREAGLLQTPENPTQEETAPDASTRSGEVPSLRSGPVKTREQALAQLRDVAAFFRATEPHSPVAYLADKAVHWGEMPLHEWLRAVVKESSVLANLEELLGVSNKENSAPR